MARSYQVVAIHVVGVVAISLSIYAITRSKCFKDTIGSVLGKKKKSLPKDDKDEAEDLEEVDEDDESSEVDRDEEKKPARTRRRGLRSKLTSCCNSTPSTQSDGEQERNEESEKFDSFRVHDSRVTIKGAGQKHGILNSDKKMPTLDVSTILSKSTGNFIEDEGGLWGYGVESCACSTPAVAQVNGMIGDSSSSCKHTCGSCKDGLEGKHSCSERDVTIHPLNPRTAGVSPLVFSEDGQRGKIFFASQSGTARKFAEKLTWELSTHNLPFELVDPATYEPEDLSKERLVIIITSTWEDGKVPKNASFLSQWLEESSEDFRVGSGLLRECRSVLLFIFLLGLVIRDLNVVPRFSVGSLNFLWA